MTASGKGGRLRQGRRGLVVVIEEGAQVAVEAGWVQGGAPAVHATGRTKTTTENTKANTLQLSCMRARGPRMTLEHTRSFWFLVTMSPSTPQRSYEPNS